jgi:uncharacterized damage-inducible protein DinB
MANNVMQKVLEYSGHQLFGVLKGFPENAMDVRPTPQAMTPRETLEHLCDVYASYVALADGKPYEYGSFRAPDRSTPALIDLVRSMREQAVQKALSATENKPVSAGVDYIALHDAYHVGQLALARMSAEPDWDPYSIYNYEY